MTTSVTTEIVDGIGLIRIDNPPVNALSNAVRGGIADAVRVLEQDPDVQAMLILCAGKTFIAGADIREFGKPRQPPSLAETCDIIEGCTKPVVAALHGTALGGGFEIALAAHYRIAASDARMGLPEVKLGLIPGAGGANRLARIAGAEQALEIVIGGNPISAADAHAVGIVDEIAENDLRVAATAFAKSLAAGGEAARPTRARAIEAIAPDAFETVVARLTRKTAGQEAPAACADSVRRAMTLPFDEAVARDREVFAQLSAGSQSRALRHVFFAEREAAKLASGSARPVARAAVVGAGTMGGGIAMSFAAAGLPVTLIDIDDAAIERGMDRIRRNYATSVERGSISAAEADQRLALIQTATTRSAAAEADLVIEAVFENMDLKRELFRELEAICRVDAVLATNTSALDVDALSAVLDRPGRFVGMHFFSPANVMKLCEIIRTDATDPDTLATAFATAKRIAKVPVLARNCDGFIGNRMVAKRSAQAERLLQEGALPQDVDEAIRAFGFPMGPLQTNDMSGLDVGYAIRKRRGTKFPIADAIAEAGRLGQKTGAGYYRYEAGSRTPVPDPETTRVIESVSASLGIERREIPREEMTERMIFALINEGAKIVAEGIAARPSDVDVVWIYGYGFPRWRGGPLAYADEVGLPYIVERLDVFAARSGDETLAPAPLLRELAQKGATFAQWQKDRA